MLEVEFFSLHARSKEAGADRHHAPAEGRGEEEGVGLDAVALDGEQSASSAQASLHLVDNQHHTVLVASLTHFAEVAVGRNGDAAFALYRLKNDGSVVARPRMEGIAHRCSVTKIDEVEASDRCVEHVLVLGIAGGRQRRHSLTVEAIACGQDAAAAGGGNTCLEGGFDSLSAAVLEGHRTEFARRKGDQ